MYRYKGIIFNSCWELAYYIYCIDTNTEITSLEIYHKLLNHIASDKDIKPYLLYIYHRYGKGYLNLFRDKRKSDFKRKIIEVNSSLDDLRRYKNKNVRFHYKCSTCGKDVYTTWHLLEHFNDNLCKYCRVH